jgi:hypothetical protein
LNVPRHTEYPERYAYASGAEALFVCPELCYRSPIGER